MNWYYANAGQQTGPISDAEFRGLLQTGAVTDQTLVWREGMTDWQPYSSVASVRSTTASPPVAGDTVTCTNCRGAFPRGEIILLDGRPYCASCKPIAIQQLKEGVIPATGAEEVRRQFIKHEASVQSIGVLYYLGGFGLLVAAGIGTVAGSAGGDIASIATAAVLGFLSVLQFIVGTGLRRLRKWARIPTGILSGLGLLGFPIGTIINGYILYLVFSKKGQMVFSDDYKAIIEQTPHIKYRTSVVVWILLGLVLLLILLGLGAALFGGTRR